MGDVKLKSDTGGLPPTTASSRAPHANMLSQGGAPLNSDLPNAAPHDANLASNKHESSHFSFPTKNDVSAAATTNTSSSPPAASSAKASPTATALRKDNASASAASTKVAANPPTARQHELAATGERVRHNFNEIIKDNRAPSGDSNSISSNKHENHQSDAPVVAASSPSRPLPSKDESAAPPRHDTNNTLADNTANADAANNRSTKNVNTATTNSTANNTAPDNSALSDWGSPANKAIKNNDVVSNHSLNNSQRQLGTSSPSLSPPSTSPRANQASSVTQATIQITNQTATNQTARTPPVSFEAASQTAINVVNRLTAGTPDANAHQARHDGNSRTISGNTATAPASLSDALAAPSQHNNNNNNARQTHASSNASPSTLAPQIGSTLDLVRAAVGERAVNTFVAKQDPHAVALLNHIVRQALPSANQNPAQQTNTDPQLNVIPHRNGDNQITNAQQIVEPHFNRAPQAASNTQTASNINAPQFQTASPAAAAVSSPNDSALSNNPASLSNNATSLNDLPPRSELNNLVRDLSDLIRVTQHFEAQAAVIGQPARQAEQSALSLMARLNQVVDSADTLAHEISHHAATTATNLNQAPSDSVRSSLGNSQQSFNATELLRDLRSGALLLPQRTTHNPFPVPERVRVAHEIMELMRVLDRIEQALNLSQQLRAVAAGGSPAHGESLPADFAAKLERLMSASNQHAVNGLTAENQLAGENQFMRPLPMLPGIALRAEVLEHLLASDGALLDVKGNSLLAGKDGAPLKLDKLLLVDSSLHNVLEDSLKRGEHHAANVAAQDFDAVFSLVGFGARATAHPAHEFVLVQSFSNSAGEDGTHNLDVSETMVQSTIERLKDSVHAAQNILGERLEDAFLNGRLHLLNINGSVRDGSIIPNSFESFTRIVGATRSPHPNLA